MPRTILLFGRVGYNTDIPALVRDYGIRPLTLPEWVRTQAR